MSEGKFQVHLNTTVETIDGNMGGLGSHLSFLYRLPKCGCTGVLTMLDVAIPLMRWYYCSGNRGSSYVNAPLGVLAHPLKFSAPYGVWSLKER
eukprot:3673736-Amphidinium_carterae.1